MLIFDAFINDIWHITLKDYLQVPKIFLLHVLNLLEMNNQ